MRIYRDIAQRSDAWYELRRGIPTASQADKIVTPTGKLSAQADALINRLLAERAGFELDQFTTDAMERGILLEGEACRYFEFETGLRVMPVAFVANDDGTAGASPDGIIELADGVLEGWESKSPEPHTHFGYLRDPEALLAKYRPQVHFSLAVSGLDRWWLQSYCPGLDPVRLVVERDDYTALIGQALAEFLGKLETEAARFGLGAERLREAA